jgi:hypothetical protein
VLAALQARRKRRKAKMLAQVSDFHGEVVIGRMTSIFSYGLVCGKRTLVRIPWQGDRYPRNAWNILGDKL